MSILRIILLLFRALFRDRSQLALENLALRQQLAILRRKVVRPRLRQAERAFWVNLARVWDQWRSALILVKPETVLRWHRQGFRYFWRWKSRGRPYVSPELIRLIRRMSQENPRCSVPSSLYQRLAVCIIFIPGQPDPALHNDRWSPFARHGCMWSRSGRSPPPQLLIQFGPSQHARP